MVRRAGRTRLAALALVGASVLLAPATAEAASQNYGGWSYAYDLDAARTLVLCDISNDGRPVRAEYKVNAAANERALVTFAGNGNCVNSQYESSHISRFKACRGGVVGWTCASNYEYTGY